MAIINGTSRPTDSTVGAAGDTYVVSGTDAEYTCIGVSEIKTDLGVKNYYIWRPVIKDRVIYEETLPEAEAHEF